MNAMDKIIKARSALIIDQRFFGALSLKLQLIEDVKAETVWTDGISLGFNSDYVNSLNMDQLKGLICHEVLHVANGHHLRRNGRDQDDWNIACDYAINDIILKNGMVLPDGGLIGEYQDMAAEQVYSAIQAKKAKKQKDNQSNNGNQGGQQAPQNNQTGQAISRQGANNKNASQPVPGEVRDYPGNPTESEKAKIQQDWKIATAQALKTAEGCGQDGGNIRELVSAMLDPKVPWQEVLQRFVEMQCHNDYTFTRPNVRYGASEVIMPSLFNRELPPIDIWVDTSGSISTEDKKQFISEINDIRSRFSTTIRIIYCDTRVTHTETIEPNDILEHLDCRGGGGTRFKPAIEWSIKNEEQPAVGIYLTDLDCTDYGSEPPFPVLWVDTRNYSYVKQPPFGEVVRMNPKRF